MQYAEVAAIERYHLGMMMMSATSKRAAMRSYSKQTTMRAALG